MMGFKRRQLPSQRGESNGTGEPGLGEFDIKGELQALE